MFSKPYGEEIRAGVEQCCQMSGDSCFMLGSAGDRFALVHFTGESGYIIDSKWMETNIVHVASSGLQASLMSSSCDVLVDMVQVS